MKIENIIFDFGGVLIDWNPRYLYRNHFHSESEMEYFLHAICTDEWNIEQDRGRTLAEGTTILQDKFPEHHDLIQLYYDGWEVMLKSDIPETVAILHKVKEKYNLYGLTNWSAETFPIAYERYSFFKEFKGIVVSGEEKMIKPDKRIFHLLFDRYHVNPEHSVFIDDNLKNIEAAKEIGLHSIHFQTPSQLVKEFEKINVL